MLFAVSTRCLITACFFEFAFKLLSRLVERNAKTTADTKRKTTADKIQTVSFEQLEFFNERLAVFRAFPGQFEIDLSFTACNLRLQP